MKDCDGIEIQLGDCVAYGARAGNSSKARLGKVIKVEDKRVRVTWVKSTDSAPSESWLGPDAKFFRIEGW